MRKPDRFKLRTALAMAAGLALCVGTRAQAQIDTDVPGGHLKVQTSLETDWGFHTAGEDNRNNNNNNIPGSGQALSTNGDVIQAGVLRADPLITYRLNNDTAQALFVDNADVYIHGRYWADLAQFINGPRVYEVGQGTYSTPGVAHYPGDGWSARISEHEYEADAAEAYIDLRKGPWALRLGKQQVVYGEELGVQTLDQVDSLDFTKFNSFEIASLEYSDMRIGEWTAKLSYQLPDMLDGNLSNSLLTGFISPDFQPDYFIGLGSQMNDVPAFEKIGDYGNLRRARNKIVYGAVVTTTAYGFDLSANFYSTPDHVGWFSLAPVANPFPADPQTGIPFLFPGDPTPRDFMLQRRFSREFIYGGSISYTMPASLDFPGGGLLAGDIFHYSVAYTPHASFTGSRTVLITGKPTKIGDLNMTLDMEKYWRWTQHFPSVYLLGEYNYESRHAPVSFVYMPSAGHHSINTVVLSATQPLPANIWSLAMTAICDTNVGGNWFLQPAVTYKPTSSQEYDIYWNFDEGTVVDTTKHVGSKLGSFSWIDAVYLRAVYKM
ncbi:MAG TPA: DUF1302 family protein [Candidatus Binataceae bacterium]|nr:DUF1302 family protein [Candidatus Binataceae bacterium]